MSGPYRLAELKLECSVCGKDADRQCVRCGIPICRADLLNPDDRCESCEARVGAAMHDADIRPTVAKPVAMAFLGTAAASIALITIAPAAWTVMAIGVTGSLAAAVVDAGIRQGRRVRARKSASKLKVSEPSHGKRGSTEE